MYKKHITTLMLSFSACANADIYETPKHIEFSYQAEDSQNYYLFDNPYSYNSQTPYNLGLTESEFKLEDTVTKIPHGTKRIGTILRDKHTLFWVSVLRQSG